VKIHCTRPVITGDGVTEISFTFDTENLQIDFDEKDHQLMLDIFHQKVQDIPELTQFVISD